MKISKRGIDLIKKYEGCRLVSYKCPAGVWTIGYGHTSGVTEGMHITQEQAENYLKKDLERYELHVSGYGKYNWNQNEFDALVSFSYNIGSIKQLTSSGFRTKQEIADRMLSYCKANGHILKGLLNRRKEEQALFLEPCGEPKSLDVLVQEVKDGVWGNGSERRKALEKAGYNYKVVQDAVNRSYGK